MPLHPLDFFDCNSALGPFKNLPPGTDWSAGALLERMDELGIAEACTHCPAATPEQNRTIVDSTSGTDRLHPVWYVGTHYTGEFPSPTELTKQMVDSGVRMARIAPGPPFFPSDFDLCGMEPLLDALAERSIVLYLDCTRVPRPPVRVLQDMLSGWPAIPVILGMAKMLQDDRYFYYLWERHANFHVELSGYQTLGAIETVTERFGSDRLVFGSRYPFFTPLQSMLQVIYSLVEEDVKRDIAGATLRKLLREVRS